MNNWPKRRKKNPQFLKGIEFNIPLFNAETQMYVCTDVNEMALTPGGKDYLISLSEVKQSYSVPERITVSLFIPHTDANGEPAHVNMLELRETCQLRSELAAQNFYEILIKFWPSIEIPKFVIMVIEYIENLRRQI
jgi:hypothetical protein